MQITNSYEKALAKHSHAISNFHTRAVLCCRFFPNADILSFSYCCNQNSVKVFAVAELCLPHSGNVWMLYTGQSSEELEIPSSLDHCGDSCSNHE